MLNMDKVIAYSVKVEDDYFEKSQKLTSIEIGHAYVMALKEKELEIALAMVKRKVSRV